MRRRIKSFNEKHPSHKEMWTTLRHRYSSGVYMQVKANPAGTTPLQDRTHMMLSQNKILKVPKSTHIQNPKISNCISPKCKAFNVPKFWQQLVIIISSYLQISPFMCHKNWIEFPIFPNQPNEFDEFWDLFQPSWSCTKASRWPSDLQIRKGLAIRQGGNLEKNPVVKTMVRTPVKSLTKTRACYPAFWIWLNGIFQEFSRGGFENPWANS